MERKIRVGAVDYLNTKPLIYGFEQGGMEDRIELLVDYPAKVAKKLLEDEIDIGLVPVAIIPSLKEHHIISSYCIGSNGPVASVCLFSEVPVEDVRTVILDYQSRTSVALFKVLLKELWKIQPVIEQGYPGYEAHAAADRAVVVIGDRALSARSKSKYIYDLGEGWKQLTGLPFVFAAWISNKKLPSEFIAEFDKNVGEGFDHLEEIVGRNPFPAYDLLKYYTTDIDYKLDKPKKQAIDLFLKKLSKL